MSDILKPVREHIIKDFVKMWFMESASPQYTQSMSVLIPNLNPFLTAIL